MDQLLTAEALLALVTLTALEIVLGIDNIIFISILAGKLPDRPAAAGSKARLDARDGDAILLLLLSIAWIMRLTAPLFTVLEQEISGRDLILGIGGLFLIWKSVREIHERLEGPTARGTPSPKASRSAACSSRSRCSISSFRWTLSSPPSGWPIRSRS